MSDCVFCQIISGEIPTQLVYQDQTVVVFNDRYPRADVHLLVVPRPHIASLNELTSEHDTLVAQMLLLLPRLAREHHLDNGYRTIINTGPGGGQVVNHLHFHLLGGNKLPGFAHGTPD